MGRVDFVDGTFRAALFGLAENGMGDSNRERSEWLPRLDVDDGREALSRPPFRADRLGVEVLEGVPRLVDALEGVSLG